MLRATLIVVAALCISPMVLAESGQSSDGPWWLGHAITAIAAVLGALMIVWQIGRQRRNEIAAQLENYKIGLRLQVYQEFAARLGFGSEALGSAGMYAFRVPIHMQMTSSSASSVHVQPITDRAKSFLELDTKGQTEMADTTLLIEKYLLIHPDMDVFRMALSSAAHDLREAFHPLFAFMLDNFPVDLVTANGQQVANVKAFSPRDIEHARSLSMAYYDKAADAQSFLTDIQTELQVVFLGALFPNSPVRRAPADPSKPVLSLEPASVKSLRQYFLKNTAWGKSAVATSLEVHRHFHGRI